MTGTYYCSGTVYTDDQVPYVYAVAYLTATSGITDGFNTPSDSSTDVPSDLGALTAICDGHIARVLTQVSPSCTIGPVRDEGGAFGNGASASSSFGFSCQGTRDEVIGVIGSFSRLPLTVGVTSP